MRASAGVAGVTGDVLVPSCLLAPPNLLVKKPKAINTLWDFVGHTETSMELWCVNRRASPVFFERRYVGSTKLVSPTAASGEREKRKIIYPC